MFGFDDLLSSLLSQLGGAGSIPAGGLGALFGGAYNGSTPDGSYVNATWGGSPNDSYTGPASGLPLGSRPYDPNTPGTGAFTGPGGAPGWNPYTHQFAKPPDPADAAVPIMSGLGQYTRDPNSGPIRWNEFPGLKPPTPAAPTSSLHLTEPPPAPRIALGEYAGGWGSGGPLGQTFQTSRNNGTTWQSNQAATPGTKTGNQWGWQNPGGNGTAMWTR